MSKQRRTFSADFKRSAASLVLDQSYGHVDASRSVGGAESVLRRWVQQLHQERVFDPAPRCHEGQLGRAQNGNRLLGAAAALRRDVGEVNLSSF